MLMGTAGIATYQKAKREGSSSVSEEDTLLKENIGMIRYHANNIYANAKEFVAYDDLINSGVMGLLEAWHNFDSTKNVKFKTFASLRVRGAMLDYLRECDWMPRHSRDDRKAISKAIMKLQTTKGMSLTEEDIARELDISVDEYRRKLSAVHCCDVVHFEDIASSLDEDDTPISILEKIESNEMLPEKQYEIVKFVDRLADGIASLDKKKQILFCLYYQEELGLKEAGLILGVSESRMSQMMKQSILELRVFLGIENIK